MDLEKHLVGSLIAGALIAAICTSGACNLLPSQPYLAIIAVAMFFGLLPDLSKSSAPQQWFYRLIFFALIYFIYKGELKFAVSLAIISIIPLLSQGYGWMHNLWSAILIPIALVLLYGIFSTKGFGSWETLNLHQIQHEIKLHLWFILASTSGWLTHILIDKTFGSAHGGKRYN